MRFAEARQHGLTEETIAQAKAPERSSLGEREKLALLFAELYITSPGSVTQELIDALKEHFTDGQIVEMQFFVGTYQILHKFNAAMDLESTDEIVVSTLADAYNAHIPA